MSLANGEGPYRTPGEMPPPEKRRRPWPPLTFESTVLVGSVMALGLLWDTWGLFPAAHGMMVAAAVIFGGLAVVTAISIF